MKTGETIEHNGVMLEAIPKYQTRIVAKGVSLIIKE